MTVIVVEDEPLSQQVMEKYIAQHPSLELVAMCSNAFDAQEVISKKTVDLMFLDINLPQISGINFLKTLLHPPTVIFTTAYPEHALESFDLDAVDYLLKPFSFERFLRAVNKAMALRKENRKNSSDHIFIKADKKVYRIQINDILDLEALGDYVKIRTIQGQHLVNSTLKDMMDELPAEEFIRVHKSFAIARNKISFIEGNFIRIADKDIPVGATYKEEVQKLLK